MAISTRNIRAYQQRGLLPAPDIRGRTGYYSEEHVQRLELIKNLQDRGFSLEGIRQMLDAWSAGGDIDELLGLKRIIADPWAEVPSIRLTRAQIEEMFPEAQSDPTLIDQAVALGVLTPLQDNVYESPEVLIRAGVAMLRLGTPLEGIFKLVELLREDTRILADHLLDVTSHQVLEPLADGALGRPELTELTETVLELRALAMDVVRPFLSQQLDAATRDALEAFRSRVEARAERDRLDGDET